MATHRRAKSRKEILELTVKELQNKARELEDHIFQLRMQFRTGQLGSTAMLGLARKEMARVKTVLTQKSNTPVKAAR